MGFHRKWTHWGSNPGWGALKSQCGNMVQAAGSIKIEPLPSTSDVLLPGSKCSKVSDAHLKFIWNIWNSLRCIFDVAWKEKSQKKGSPNNTKWWREACNKTCSKTTDSINKVMWYMMILIYLMVISVMGELREKIRRKQREPRRSQRNRTRSWKRPPQKHNKSTSCSKLFGDATMFLRLECDSTSPRIAALLCRETIVVLLLYRSKNIMLRSEPLHACQSICRCYWNMQWVTSLKNSYRYQQESFVIWQWVILRRYQASHKLGSSCVRANGFSAE